MNKSEIKDLFSHSPLFVDVGGTEIAYRKYGTGAPLLFLHGWPLSGVTFRNLLPEISKHFTCYLIDLPGSGETRWSEKTDFTFKGQADNVKAFIDKLGLKSYSLFAHNTGATIGRRLAIIDPDRVKKLVVLGTEIPNHRPPWVPLYQKISYLPGNGAAFRLLLSSRAFRKSNLGFGGCFFNQELIEGEFYKYFIDPLLKSKIKMRGQIFYLRGIDWSLIDSLASEHAKIKAPTFLLWGENDTVFPIELAKKMSSQFRNLKGFKTIPNTRLFAHEEQPEQVGQASIEFLMS